MVKSKKGKRPSTKPGKAKAIMLRPVVASSGREGAYKRLLLDPCNAELGSSPYGGDAGAIVQRTHKVFNNTSVSYLVFFHPVLGEYIVDGVGLQNVRPLNGVAQMTGGTARGIAGCLETIYTGAENARSGTVQCAVIPGTVVWNYMSIALGGGGAQLDLVNIAARFQNLSRMPVDRCAVNWFPSEADGDFIPPITLNSAQGGATEKIFASTHFAAAFITGVAVNDVRFSSTSVYEANSYSASTAGTLDQYPWSIAAKSSEPVNVRKVLRDLATQDTRWYLDTFKKVAKFGLGLASSAMRAGLPGALGFLTSSMVGGPSYGGSKSRNVSAAD